MNGILRLIWTYLYRCQESTSTAISKLETLLKHFFPANRLSVVPNDDQLDPFIYIVHFILCRHPEYGRDLCLELMQEATITSQPSNLPIPIAPERTIIAMEAILLSLHAIERDEPTPTWPSSSDFDVVPPRKDYPESSDFVPASILAKPGMQQFFERCGTTLGIIAFSCANSVGSMSIADDQWAYPRPNIGYEESPSFTIRRHEECTVAYSTILLPQIVLLRTCFQCWPRCLHPTVPLGDAIDMLIRGVIHVEPSLGEAACAALKRFMTDPSHALSVLSRLTSFIFNPVRTVREGSGVKLLPEFGQLLNLWVDIVDNWISTLLGNPKDSFSEDEKKSIITRVNDVEAGALFLLSYEIWSIHIAGVKVVRSLGLLLQHITPDPSSSTDGSDTPVRFIDMLHGKGIEKSYLYGYDELLDGPHLDRLEQWRKSAWVDILLRIADSANEKDRWIWRLAFPRFMQRSMDHPTHTLTTFRETLVAAVTRYHTVISPMAGLSTRTPVGLSSRPQTADREGAKSIRDNKYLVGQWHAWVKILCSTATHSESRPAHAPLSREHTRALSDASFERERLTTSRGLFRYLTPFLDSEHTTFRDAAVLCISSLPSTVYPQLLEDLSLLATRQFYDESRSKSAGQVVEQNLNSLAARQVHDDARSRAPGVDRSRRQERLHSAVARIYYLTAQYLPHQRSAGRQAALVNVLKFVRNTQSFLTAPEMRDNYTLQRLRRYFCGTVERLFDGLSTLKDSDRFIPPNMHLVLYRICEEWCHLGPQSDVVKHRFQVMHKAAVINAQVEPDCVELFQRDSMILSHAAVGALASLCVGTMITFASLSHVLLAKGLLSTRCFVEFSDGTPRA
jgi:hypothetical protein